MSKCYRKIWEDEITYHDKSADHKKHNYCIPYILAVTYTAEREWAYMKREYINVLKCDKCNSFTAVNIKGSRFNDNPDLEHSNVITAYYKGKNFFYRFNELDNLNFIEKKYH